MDSQSALADRLASLGAAHGFGTTTRVLNPDHNSYRVQETTTASNDHTYSAKAGGGGNGLFAKKAFEAGAADGERGVECA